MWSYYAQARTEKDGTLKVLADRYQGKRFNQPNDVTVDSQGRIYFSDPKYGPRDTIEMVDAEGREVDRPRTVPGPQGAARSLARLSQRRER